MTMGNVTLLGAGCGKGLITLEGYEILKNAEAVVYDDLIDVDLLLDIREDCELIYVGKRFETHSHSQEEINQILIDKAAEGKRVVRLKGGDGFVFGRGGEEMIALKEAGVPARIIPGISSSIAVPERMGIPVTHRGVAQSVTMITGHTATNRIEDYEALAKMRGTLVFMMGLNSAPVIAEELMKRGKSGDTPVAILCNGYRANEKQIRGTLKETAELVKQAFTPAIFVVGEVAAFSFENTMPRPLGKTSVTVTGTKYMTDKLEKLFREKGAHVEKHPVIKVCPDYSQIPEDFSGYDWLAFTSANGIRIFFDHIRETKIDYRKLAHLKFACIGTGTADMLESYGFTADFIPTDYTAEVMGEELGNVIENNEKLLILRAANGSKLLNEKLDQAGTDYEDRHIYTTSELSKKIINQDSASTDYIVFASAMGAKAYLKDHEVKEGTKIVCIGEATAKVLEGSELLMPKRHTADAIVELVMEDYRKNAEK